MTERSHDRSNSEGVTDLVYSTKPRSDIRNVLGDWEVGDVVHEVVGRLDTTGRDTEAKEVNLR